MHDFYSQEFRDKLEFAFNGMFGEFKRDFQYVAVIYLAKRMLVAGMIGGLSVMPILQLALIAGTSSLYFLFIFFKRPFVHYVDNKV